MILANKLKSCYYDAQFPYLIMHANLFLLASGLHMELYQKQVIVLQFNTYI